MLHWGPRDDLVGELDIVEPGVDVYSPSYVAMSRSA